MCVRAVCLEARTSPEKEKVNKIARRSQVAKTKGRLRHVASAVAINLHASQQLHPPPGVE